MPSPFPGMNPYLEQADVWEDFHTNFIARAQEILTELVGAKYFVKLEVRLLLHELSAEERQLLGKGDLEIGTASSRADRAPSNTSQAAPVQLSFPAVEVEKQAYLEIRDRARRRLITVLELLSPSNKKSGVDRDDYLAKRRSILATTTHFVEIDLRRGGLRPDFPVLPSTDYYALVSRSEDRPQVGFWPIGLRDPLPTIPIPLEEPDPDVRLNLRLVLDRAYDAAGYARYVYQGQPEPPLAPEDEAWAAQYVPKPI